MVDTLTYVGRRFVNLLIVLWIAGTLNFAIPRLMPGDPVEQAFLALAVRGGPSQDVAALKASYEEKLGLDEPVLVQYVNYWIGVATLDLGVSVVKYPTKVTSVIGPSLPWTLGLLGMSTIIAFVIGTLLGAFLAWPRSAADPALPRAAVHGAVGDALLPAGPDPDLDLRGRPADLPAGGRLQPDPDPRLRTSSPSWTWRTTRSCRRCRSCSARSASGRIGMRALMIGVLGEDYITYAESKGLKPRRVFLRYGLRNSLLPQVTALAIALGTVVSGRDPRRGDLRLPGPRRAPGRSRSSARTSSSSTASSRS